MKTTIAFLQLIFLAVICFGQANEPSSGHSLQFDGNDFATVPSSPSLLIAGQVTMEAWIKIEGPFGGAGNKGNIVFKVNSSTTCNFNHLDLRATNSRQLEMVLSPPNACAGTNVYLTGATTMALNTWYHVAGSYDGAVAKLYVNGVVDATQNLAITMSPVPNTPLSIGANVNNNTWGGCPSPCRYFNGRIDEVRVWAVCRTQEEIRKSMCKKLNGSEVGLAAYWRMDEGTGNTVEDSSPNVNHGSF